MIAMALACRPSVLIADEPTTALDVTIQAQILDLMEDLQAQLGMALVFITHDLGVVAQIADRVLVMYAGQVVEAGPVADLFARPRMPYTAGLLASIPRAGPIAAGRPSPRHPRPGADGRAAAGWLPLLDSLRPRRAALCRDRTWPRGNVARARGPLPALARAAAGRRSLRVSDALLRIDRLVKHFPIHGGLLNRVVGQVRAVDGVSFAIRRGEVRGPGRRERLGQDHRGAPGAAARPRPRLAACHFDGTDVLGAGDVRRCAASASACRSSSRIPYASLNPRETGRRHARPRAGLARDRHAGRPRRPRRGRCSSRSGCSADHLDRFPHEFSGGQRQRIVIARALAVQPEFLVADEPVSALDVSIQAQVINLLADLKDRLGLTMLFIAHDLAVVEHICDRVVVMYLGKIMEIAPSATLYRQPNHPYTEALLSAVPVPEPGRRRTRMTLTGDIPSPTNPPSGCVFRTRCPRAVTVCAETVPELKPIGVDHFSACHLTT